jgi:hypothetical protein
VRGIDTSALDRTGSTPPPAAVPRRVWEAARAHPVRALVVVWAASRVAYLAAGLRFEAGGLDHSMQLIDAELLRHDLWRSLWYSHAQPPGFNLFVAGVLWLPGTVGVLRVLYLTLGLAVMLLLHRLLRRLGVAPGVALGVALVWAVLPATAIYEAYFSYTLPVAAALLGVAACLHAFVRTGHRAWGLGFVGLLTLLTLIRSSYHLLWALVPLALLAVAAPRFTRRSVVVLAGLPLLLTAGVYVKNYVVFDQFGATSWTGMHLARVVLDRREPAERARGSSSWLPPTTPS